MSIHSSLLKWLATFHLEDQPALVLNEEAYYNLADGYICGRILNQISEEHFPNSWLQGIRPVPPNGSWRMRVSNLKRISGKIDDYASYRQSLPNNLFTLSNIKLDLAVIAQNFDPDQINKLIQMILFCAINCEKQGDYIKNLSKLPTRVQEDIKEAIQELLIKSPDSPQEKLNNNNNINTSSTTLGPTTTTTPNASQMIVDKGDRKGSFHGTNLTSPQRNLNISSPKSTPNIRTFTPTSSEQKQLKILTSTQSEQLDEYSPNTITRRSNLESRTSGSSASSNYDDNQIKFEENLLLQQNKRLLIQLQQFKEELVNVEAEKEDLRVRCDLYKGDLDKITRKHDEARSKAELSQRLQDEVDELKHLSEKIANYEIQMQNLVRKNNELKKELQNHEDKNSSQMGRIMSLEEENGQLANGAGQMQLYKKKLQEIQAKLTQESHRAEKAELEYNLLNEKYSATKKENERLYETTNQLLAMNTNSGATSGSDNSGTLINRVEELQRLLFQKEQQLAECEAKYQKNVKKAKELMKQLNQNNNLSMAGSLHASCISSVSSLASNSYEDTNMLKQQLKEREDKIIDLERESYEFKKVKEIHERLMITAFYGLVSI